MTSAEVMQEVLHHALSVVHEAEGFWEFMTVMQGRIEAVYAGDIERAGRLAEGYTGLETRDLVHAAVTGRLGLQHIVSADRRLSRIQTIERLDPAQLDTWVSRIG